MVPTVEGEGEEEEEEENVPVVEEAAAEDDDDAARCITWCCDRDKAAAAADLRQTTRELGEAMAVVGVVDECSAASGGGRIPFLCLGVVLDDHNPWEERVETEAWLVREENQNGFLGVKAVRTSRPFEFCLF